MSEEIAVIGWGSTVRIGRFISGATEPVFTELDLIGDLELPDEQTDEVEGTHMKSPGKRRQYIGGLIDSGSVAVPMNYVPGSDTDVLIKQIKAARETVVFEITASAIGTPEKYAAFCSGYSRTAPVGEKMTAEATFRLSEVIED